MIDMLSSNVFWMVILFIFGCWFMYSALTKKEDVVFGKKRLNQKYIKAIYFVIGAISLSASVRFSAIVLENLIWFLNSIFNFSVSKGAGGDGAVLLGLSTLLFAVIVGVLFLPIAFILRRSKKISRRAKKLNKKHDRIRLDIDHHGEAIRLQRMVDKGMKNLAPHGTIPSNSERKKIYTLHRLSALYGIFAGQDLTMIEDNFAFFLVRVTDVNEYMTGKTWDIICQLDKIHPESEKVKELVERAKRIRMA